MGRMGDWSQSRGNGGEPGEGATLAVLKDTSRYQRNDILMEAGWATMPGSTDPNSNVARACMDQLATLF
jgi:hypothetical protein